MRHCYLGLNITFAFPKLTYKNLFYLENNRLKGLLGSVPDKYLELYRPNFCKIILVEGFGQKLGNGSFSGALNLIKKKIVDVYSKPEALYLNEDFLTYSKTIFQENFLIGQIGFDLSKTKSNQDILSIFDLESYIKYFAFFIFIIAFLILFKLINLKPIKKKLIFILEILFNLKKINSNFGLISLIILFYNIYLMIFCSIITNNIKSTKVILNTSEIIDSKQSVLTSSKMICWLSDENELLMAKTSPPDTFLFKAYNRKQINYITNDYSLCTFQKKPNLELLGSMNKAIFLLSKLSMTGLFSIVSSFQQDAIYWISDNSIFEMIMVFYYRKGLKSDGLRFITEQEFECSLQENVNKQMYQRLISTFEFKTKFYQRKVDFINDFTYFDDLSLSYFLVSINYGFYFFILLFFLNLIQIIYRKFNFK